VARRALGRRRRREGRRAARQGLRVPRRRRGGAELAPEDGAELRAAYPSAVGDAPYLAKRHWVRIDLDGTVPDDELRELLQTSYALVVRGLPRAQRPQTFSG
jgi:hypothetical protein